MIVFKLWAFFLLVTFRMKLIEFKVLYKALNSFGNKIKVTKPSYVPDEFRSYSRYVYSCVLFQFNDKWIACGVRDHDYVDLEIRKRFVRKYIDKAYEKKDLDIKELERRYGILKDIPCDDDGLIEEAFFDFPIGTDREDIWHWFDERHPEGYVKGLRDKSHIEPLPKRKVFGLIYMNDAFQPENTYLFDSAEDREI